MPPPACVRNSSRRSQSKLVLPEQWKERTNVNQRALDRDTGGGMEWAVTAKKARCIPSSWCLSRARERCILHQRRSSSDKSGFVHPFAICFAWTTPLPANGSPSSGQRDQLLTRTSPDAYKVNTKKIHGHRHDTLLLVPPLRLYMNRFQGQLSVEPLECRRTGVRVLDSIPHLQKMIARSMPRASTTPRRTCIPRRWVGRTMIINVPKPKAVIFLVRVLTPSW